jgi:tetratricopeptide (TPR) repeat protein
MQLNQFEKAIREFNINIEEVIKQFGESWAPAYTFFYKARCLQKLNRVEEALGVYDSAIQHSPYCTEAHYYKGQALLSRNKKTDACASIKQAYDLINQNEGYKQADIYVELFDEVYKQQIEDKMNECGCW